MRFTISFLFILLTGLFPAAASPHTEASLVAEVETIEPGEPFWAGVHLKMDPGWHTYWRNSGDSGIPTQIEWQLPEGFEAGPVRWPYPERIDLPPLAVYAYENEVLLMTRIHPPGDLAAGEKVTLRADVRWLECEVNCIPGSASLETTLLTAAQAVPDPDQARLFARFRSQLPLPDSEWRIRAFYDTEHILFKLSPPKWFEGSPGKAAYFDYDAERIDHAAAQPFRRSGEGYELLVKRSGIKTGELAKLEGILVSQKGWRGPETEKAIGLAVKPQQIEEIPLFESGAAPTPFLAAVLFAFIGGILLNLMPCVFPVLSLKMMGLIDQAHGHRVKIWQHGAVFTAGILVSFWILAGALLLLRASGEAVGWGFQLQSPLFIAVLCFLFFGLALNLFGVFEVGTSLTGLGRFASGKKGLEGSFLSGILAAVVATPCTAPFMGSALGFAVTQPAVVAVAVFTFLGLGMAFPYVVLSLFPAFLDRLPQPGPWMVHMKKAMGFVLLATVVWLFWVLSLQVSAAVLPFVVLGFFLMGFGCWLSGILQGRRSRRARAGKCVAVLIVLAGILIPLMSIRSGFSSVIHRAQGRAPASAIEWVPYNENKLQSLIDEGKPVFLDFTAAWCLSCHVNEKVALDSRRVVEKIRKLDIVMMKADWTNRDPEITQALSRYGRTSIPLYVLYGAGEGSEPVILPEILTPGIVLEALDKVEKNL